MSLFDPPKCAPAPPAPKAPPVRCKGCAPRGMAARHLRTCAEFAPVDIDPDELPAMLALLEDPELRARYRR